MMMREVLIWKMRRSSHPKRRARPARVKVSINTHCPMFSVYSKGRCTKMPDVSLRNSTQKVACRHASHR
jgi:hypothetical protein